ncbi:uncharacterized protein LOC128379345 [Scomber scombrus]|uniref:Uncharacterized protein LOC128379345 n=1 Tax=Scomber scombrus TaxID=13677 RepID=A0AAV1QGG8_SCOSC
MYQQTQFQWAEDDFTLPEGVGRLGLSAPDVDKEYVMYHGTTRENAVAILRSGFRRSADGMLGPGVYLSRDLNKASRYPINHPDYDKVVIVVSVNVGKVIAINKQDHPLLKTWHYFGYDTAWVPPNCGMVPSGLEEDCVWDPNQITILRIIQPQPTQPGYRYTMQLQPVPPGYGYNMQPQPFPPGYGYNMQPQPFQPGYGYNMQPQPFQPGYGYNMQPQLFQPGYGYNMQPQLFQPGYGYNMQPQLFQPGYGYNMQPQPFQPGYRYGPQGYM